MYFKHIASCGHIVGTQSILDKSENSEEYFIEKNEIHSLASGLGKVYDDDLIIQPIFTES